MGMGVAVVVGVIVGMVVRHGELLYYNITGVHACLSRVSLSNAPATHALVGRPRLRKPNRHLPEHPKIPRRLNVAADEGDQFLR